MRRRANGDGTIFKPKGSRYWWVGYHSGGKRHFESSKSERKTDAKELLDQRVGHIRSGVAVTPKVGKLTIADGLQSVLDYQTTRGKKSVDSTKRRIEKHLLRWFGPDRQMARSPATRRSGIALREWPRARSSRRPTASWRFCGKPSGWHERMVG